jgi:putative ABC transport system ATP-binding protein
VDGPIGRGVEARLVDVYKRFRVGDTDISAVSGVSLDIPAGVHWALEGASGSGKSTLLYLLGLLERPSSGEVWLDGIPTGSMETGERALFRNRRIGFVFQNFQLIPRTTALENVEMPLVYRRLPPRERRECARRMLEGVGLSGREDHFPSQLSGGQQQRVAIARALITEPGLVLADEPTGNLDSASADDILRLLESLREKNGFTLLVVTHDPDVGGRAQCRVRMKDGRISEVRSE